MIRQLDIATGDIIGDPVAGPVPDSAGQSHPPPPLVPQPRLATLAEEAGRDGMQVKGMPADLLLADVDRFIGRQR